MVTMFVPNLAPIIITMVTVTVMGILTVMVILTVMGILTVMAILTVMVENDELMRMVLKAKKEKIEVMDITYITE